MCGTQMSISHYHNTFTDLRIITEIINDYQQERPSVLLYSTKQNKLTAQNAKILFKVNI